MSESYDAFLRAKVATAVASGLDREPADLHGPLFPFQRDITLWALKLGRSCVFADCGLGKTIMQLEWAHQVADSVGQVLILTPLAVANQTEREAQRFGYDARVCASMDDAKRSRICITNYEKLDRFDADSFDGVVLDESSILKSYTGKYRNALIQRFAQHRFKLACTATPAPNDVMELGNHAEFVGAMSRTEMLAMFFTHDGGETQKWRLKNHGRTKFWEWVSTWATVITKPSDMGYSDEGFTLPALNYTTHNVESEHKREGLLFEVGSPSMTERRDARRASIEARCEAAAQMANADTDQWVIWCDLNAESSKLADMIPDAVEVRGSDGDDHKRDAMTGFADGSVRVLVTKPKIAGFGMNWQNCHQMAFVGLSDSYEALYQSTRRCWRFGQKHDVRAHIITSTAEGAVLENVQRKEREHHEMQLRLAELVGFAGQSHKRGGNGGSVKAESGNGWTLYNGDCIEVVGGLDDASIDYTVFSPPFSSLYTYSDSDRDMGNSRDDEEFYAHFGFLAPELYRVTAPGRLLSFHCMTLPTSKVRDGVIGLKDFRGDMIRIFQAAGWVYHSEVCIWKDPVTAMQRTKALGLLHKTIRKDSAMSRQGLPDYVVTMRKPGENRKPIAHPNNEFPVSLWQRWASPVWTDINPNETLQYMSAREDDDERHICPLQLEVIRRCLGLWTAPGDTVLSPFAGIGSEGHEAVRWGRKFIGVELKQSYFDVAVKNLREAEVETNQAEMFA